LLVEDSFQSLYGNIRILIKEEHPGGERW